MENEPHLYLGLSGLANRPQEMAKKYNNLLNFLGPELMLIEFERFIDNEEFNDLISQIEDTLFENDIISPNTKKL